MKKLSIFLGFCFVAILAIYFSKKETSIQATDLSSTQAATDPQKFMNKHQYLMDQVASIVLSIEDKNDVKKKAKVLIQLSAENPEFIGPKLFAGIAQSLLKLEGIIWRSRGFVEKSDWLHSTALFQLRNFSNYNYLYGKHVEALFDFIVSPPSNTDEKPMFKQVNDLTGYLNSKDFVGEVETLISQLKAADQKPSYEFAFDFDRRIINGFEDNMPLIDKDEAKRKFIKPYLYTLTFLLQRFAATIHYLDPINLNDLSNFSNAMLKKTALNTIENKIQIPFFGGKQYDVAPGVTPMMLYTTMEKFPAFLTVRKDAQGDSYNWSTAQWQKAFDLNAEAAKYQLAAFVCGITYTHEARNGSMPSLTANECLDLDVNSYKNNFIENGDDYIFNPNRMLIDLKSKYKSIKDRAVAYEQNKKNSTYAAVTSDVTGQTLMVNLKAVYTIPKNGDLKAVYFPKTYEAANAPGQKTGDTWAWNYNHGKPQTFKDPTFNGFFQDGTDPYKNMTTLMYTGALAPFGVWLRVPNPTRFIDVPF